MVSSSVRPATQRRCISLNLSSWDQGTNTRTLNTTRLTFTRVCGHYIQRYSHPCFSTDDHIVLQSIIVVRMNLLLCIQWSGRGWHVDGLRGEDVLGSQQLPPRSGIRHDEPGPGLRHRPPGDLGPEEHLHPSYVSFFGGWNGPLAPNNFIQSFPCSLTHYLCMFSFLIQLWAMHKWALLHTIFRVTRCK